MAPWLLLALGMILLPVVLPAFWPERRLGLLSVSMHLAGLLLVPCLFGLRVRTLLRLCWPFVVLVPVAVFCHLTTRQQPSEWFFLVLSESNTTEASVFIPQVIGFVALLGVLVFAYRWVLRRESLRGVRLGPLGTCAVLLYVLLLPAMKATRTGAAQAWKEEVWRVTENFPVGTVTAGVKAALLRHQIAHRGDVGSSLVVTSTGMQPPAGKREIHVLVLGETARAASFQINGYDRETTPILSKLPGIVSFSDAVAPAPVTTISVPVLLTPTDATHVQESSVLPSVMSVFRKAGFRTYWLSTQSKHGFWDTRCSTYANDADEARFLSSKLALSGEPRDASHDENLLPAVKEILARGEPKVLLVLHTMGSHAIYADRYPEAFNHFPADPAICAEARAGLLDSKLKPEHVPHLRNSYDNSIRYTDFVLSRLIGLLGDADAIATLCYVSDHGENGADAPMMRFGHGTLTSDVLRVPLIVWLSPGCEALRPACATALREHRAAPVSTSGTFHAMMDLAGLDCSLRKPALSFANPGYQPSPRLVTALDGRVLDFDKDIKPLEEKRHGWRPLVPRVAQSK